MIHCLGLPPEVVILPPIETEAADASMHIPFSAVTSVTEIDWGLRSITSPLRTISKTCFFAMLSGLVPR
jgi:hypothetical protein